MKIITTTKLEKIIKKLVLLLKIQKATQITVTTEDMPLGHGGYMVQEAPGVYKIVMNSKLSKNKMIKGIAHEMIHVAQYDRGDLETIVTQVGIHTRVTKSWKGKEICLITTSYMNLPWEKEAFEMMNIVAQQARK